MRRAQAKDLTKVIEVEAKSTPNLRYLQNVFDLFLSDRKGEFSVAEIDGEVVACGKFTIVPDGSAWLEALRVIPERQGMGIGKRFYKRFFELAHNNGVKTMRMYTGIRNVVSKGLTERFNFKLAQTFKAAYFDCSNGNDASFKMDFKVVSSPKKAIQLLIPLQENWANFLVMNRTFYSLTPALCTDLFKKRQVYEDETSKSVITLGARFMPEEAIHIGMYGGDVNNCINFAKKYCEERHAKRLSCLYPSTYKDIENDLTSNGFQIEAREFLVMEVHLT